MSDTQRERVLTFGSWPSPLTAADVSAASPRIDGARYVAGEIWWGESVPAEGGRSGVRRRTREGATEEVLPDPWSARSRVNEYGGGSWAVTSDGVLLFVERTDQRVWMLSPGGAPRALTPEGVGMRFGGLTVQAGRLLAIRETHEDEKPPRRDIVEVALDGSGVTSLVGGSDFLAHPALSPGGELLAWVAWDHPHMPWDRSELRVGRIDDDGVRAWTTVAGGASSPLQPEWRGEHELVYADDVTGRWNLWRLRIAGDAGPAVVGLAEPIAEADADTGGPLWVLGSRWFALLADGSIAAVRTDGDDVLVHLGASGDPGSVQPLDVPPVAELLIEDSSGTRVLVTGSPADAPAGLWEVDAAHPDAPRLISGGGSPWGAEWMPTGRALTVDGPRGPVHAIDFAPAHPAVRGPEDERPPYLVYVHGGPTAHRGSAASARIAYFTSRGIGVVEVNYGGSSGYGRAYRERLRGQWGVVDVQDVAAVARSLGDEGRADPRRLTVAGGSAGGWTVLSALVSTDVFAAGISRYGVGDARMLAEDTHDFEAHYLDGLIGPLPEAADLYAERSPLSHPERFRVPLLLLQGADDPVVPPSQSEAIRDALAAHGIPHAYILYPGEGHGFRRRETVIDALESELAFLGAVFGFRTPGVAPLALSGG